MTKINGLRVKDAHPELPLDPDALQPGLSKLPYHSSPLLQLLVLVGGGFGTIARYYIESLVPISSGGWPKATFIINLLGAFMLGFLLEALTHRGPDTGKLRMVRLGVGTGLIGGFTTYSTFSVEVVTLHKNGYVGVALSYILISIVGGLLCCLLGIYLAGRHHRRATGVSS